ncbi:unnamed protein product, partial [Nesidiocoris tenuis]
MFFDSVGQTLTPLQLTSNCSKNQKRRGSAMPPSRERLGRQCNIMGMAVALNPAGVIGSPLVTHQ